MHSCYYLTKHIFLKGLLFVVVAGFALFAHHAAASIAICHSGAKPTPSTGFGAGFNLFSAKQELLMEVECDPETKKTRIETGNGASSIIVYKQGYVFKSGGWQSITFSGGKSYGSEWYQGSAHAATALPDAEIGELQYVLSYSCHWDGAWRCGCSDTQCSESKWQLQTFTFPDQSSRTSQPVTLGIASRSLNFTVPHNEAELHAYNKNDVHTGKIPAPSGSDLEFFDENIPNSNYTVFGNSTLLTMPVGSKNYAGDDYYRIEILPLKRVLLFLEIAVGNDKLVTHYIPVSPDTKMRILVTENDGTVDLNRIQYDIDGDGDVDTEISHVTEDRFETTLALIPELYADTLSSSDRQSLAQRVAEAEDYLQGKPQKGYEQTLLWQEAMKDRTDDLATAFSMVNGILWAYYQENK